MYEDKTLVCKDCGNEFVFTAGEQEFYAEKGFVNEPQRCKACRSARKAAARGPISYICDFSRCKLNVRLKRSHPTFAPRPQI